MTSRGSVERLPAGAGAAGERARRDHDCRHAPGQARPRGGVRGVPRGDHRRGQPVPGLPRVEVFRPSGGSDEYRIVYRFDGPGDLGRWLDSDEHAAWLERAEPHVIGPMRTSFLTGLESWFTLPDRPGAPPPPPYKMALLTWLTIFPLITLVVLALEPVLTGLALVPRLAITTAITVPLMTWVVMPRVTRALRGWLFPG